MTEFTYFKGNLLQNFIETVFILFCVLGVPFGVHTAVEANLIDTSNVSEWVMYAAVLCLVILVFFAASKVADNFPKYIFKQEWFPGLYTSVQVDFPR